MWCYFCSELIVPSVLWCCWLGGRKGIRPVKHWVVGCWRGYLSGARCRLAYGPADATATLASVKSRLVLPFWYLLTQVVPDKGPLNVRVCNSNCWVLSGTSAMLCCRWAKGLSNTRGFWTSWKRSVSVVLQLIFLCGNLRLPSTISQSSTLPAIATSLRTWSLVPRR